MKTCTVSCHPGWFMSASAVGAESLQSSVLISPEIKGSSPTCRLRLRYFLWDSGNRRLLSVGRAGKQQLKHPKHSLVEKKKRVKSLKISYFINCRNI